MKISIFFCQIACGIFLLLSVTFNAYAQVIPKHINESKNFGIMGMNAHLTFPCSINYMGELCKSMANAGVAIVRLDLYWSPKNMYYQIREFDRASYYVTKYGMEIELNMPQIPINLDKNTLKKWVEVISYCAKRYDGSTPIDIGNGEEPRRIRIRYFEIMNEPEHWQKVGLTVEELYNFVKLSTNAIRAVRQNNDAYVVLPGISRQCDFTKSLLCYKDEAGKSLKDYVDIVNFHYYSDNEKMFWLELAKWKSFFCKDTDMLKKPIWMTEYGHSLWDVTERKQSSFLPKQALIAATLGVNKIFYYQFHQFGGNYFARNQKEDYFGIIDTSISNSYGSFWRNDGSFKTPICEGDGTRKIYITQRVGNKFLLNTLTDNICKELKQNGIAIGGQGFVIRSVVLKKSDNSEKILFLGNFVVPWKGKKRKVLKISADFFAEVNATDKLIVNVKDVFDTTDHWDGVHPLQSYYSYKTIVELISNAYGFSRDVGIADVNIVSWKVDNRYRYALWTISGKSYRVTTKSGNIRKIINCYGKKINARNNSVEVGDEVVYLESESKLEFTVFN